MKIRSPEKVFEIDEEIDEFRKRTALKSLGQLKYI
jgi:hypothetical protein